MAAIEALAGISTMGKTLIDAEGNVGGGTFWAPMVRDMGMTVRGSLEPPLLGASEP